MQMSLLAFNIDLATVYFKITPLLLYFLVNENTVYMLDFLFGFYFRSF